MAASIIPLAADYLHGIKLPGGIHPSEWDEPYDLTSMDEVARCGYLGVIFGLVCGNTIGIPPVIRFSRSEKKSFFVPDVLAGRARFCLGVTEPDTGSDVVTSYIVKGNKMWITNAIWTDYCTAAVRTGGGKAEGHLGARDSSRLTGCQS